MRIRDWSSDVGSCDLGGCQEVDQLAVLGAEQWSSDDCGVGLVDEALRGCRWFADSVVRVPAARVRVADLHFEAARSRFVFEKADAGQFRDGEDCRGHTAVVGSVPDRKSTRLNSSP